MNFCLALLHTILCDCILFYEVKLRSLYRKTAHIFTKKNRRLNHSKQCEYIRIIFGRLKMSISDGGSLGNREKKNQNRVFGTIGFAAYRHLMPNFLKICI